MNPRIAADFPICPKEAEMRVEVRGLSRSVRFFHTNSGCEECFFMELIYVETGKGPKVSFNWKKGT